MADDLIYISNKPFKEDIVKLPVICAQSIKQFLWAFAIANVYCEELPYEARGKITRPTQKKPLKFPCTRGARHQEAQKEGLQYVKFNNDNKSL